MTLDAVALKVVKRFQWWKYLMTWVVPHRAAIMFNEGPQSFTASNSKEELSGRASGINSGTSVES